MSISLDGPFIDIMEILMRGIIKRKNKWVEWIRVRRNKTRVASSTNGVVSRITQSSIATSNSVATSKLVRLAQFVGGGGHQLPKKNM